jgi:hypothetical protein
MRCVSIVAGRILLLVGLVLPTSTYADFLNLPIVRWKWVETVDRVTDELRSDAGISTNSVNIAGSSFGHSAIVVLSCVRGKYALIFGWSTRVAAQKNLLVEYRFAGRPGHATAARYVNRSRQMSLSVMDIGQFLADARLSNNLYVRVYSDTYGTSEATFTAFGGKEMAAKFIAVCPKAAGASGH